MPNTNELSKKQDRELVELLMGGSQAALGELYARYRERLIHLCRRSLKNEADSEDVVHDIFVKLWENRHSLANVSSFSGFVQTMAQNYITDKLRHLDVHLRFAKNVRMKEIDSTNETEDAIIDNDYTELLNKLIESLPTMQREIFRLNRVEGRTYKDISEILKMPVGNVRRYAALASKKIKDQLLKRKIILFLTIITFLTFFL